MRAKLVRNILLLLCVGCAGIMPAVTDFHMTAAGTLAPARTVVRIMTYNIHVGVGMDKQLNIPRIADVINQEKADLVALQEVDRGVKRTQGIDEIAELARLTKMEFAFAHNLDYQGGQYGVAVLSRFPILNTDHRMYQNKREAERRGMLRVQVKAGSKLLDFVTTHLDYQYEDGRVFEATQLLDFLKQQNGIMIVAGDFNVEPTGESYKLMATRFSDAWQVKNAKDPGFTFPADKPAKRIDYILFRNDKRIHVVKVSTVNTLASDHIPLIAEIEFH